MNYKSKNWWDRFGHLSADNDSGDGGGGGADSGADASADDGGDDGISANQDSDEPAQNQDADPPRSLTADEIRAKLAEGSKTAREAKKPEPKAKEPKVDPKAKAKAPVQKPDTKGKKEEPPVDPRDQKLDRIVSALEKATLNGQPPEPKTKDQGGAPEKVNYFSEKGPGKAQINVPEQFMAAIDHEDPKIRHQGVTALVNSMGNLFMDQHAQEMASYHQFMVERVVPQMVVSLINRLESNKTFYSEYPDLDTPDLHPIVDQQGQKLAQAWEKAGKQFMVKGRPSPEFMQAVAEAVAGLIPGTQNVVQAPSQQAQNPVNSKKQPHWGGKVSRPPARTSQDDKSAAILASIMS